jgi:DNA-binding NarL/FixJ family response regulator
MTAPDGQPRQHRPRILVVDDEPFNVDYLEQELESHGYLTDTAQNGFEALEQVALSAPDLVLLDVMMPGMDGISVLRILKEDPETRLIPVVLMTALNAVDDRIRGIEAGADDFLSKPVDERELLARIRTALSLKRAIDEKVDELHSASAHLEQYGSHDRDLAILALQWRSDDPSLPSPAIAFVARSERVAAEQRIGDLGGIPTERQDDLIVAGFDGPDPRARTMAAVEAGLALVQAQPVAGERDSGSRVLVSAAIALGTVRIGSTRSTGTQRSSWVFAAEGDPVNRAIELASSADGAGLVLAEEAAALVRDAFRLEPSPAGHRVRARAAEAARGEDAPVDRSITTVLVTDIVGSTRTAERIGDRAWAQLLGSHERVVRGVINRFGGWEIDTTGDGFIASFANPTQAIHCAREVVASLALLGLSVRAGIHTGEVEHVEGRPRGIALHVASRIAGKAAAGEILVSATTRELARGARLLFTDRGEHMLKGVSDPRRLFAAAEAPAPSSEELAVGGLPGARTTYPAGLTPREVDVLRLVALGLSDAETARRLFVSVRTVNAHLRSIYRKAGVQSRAAASRFAEQNDLL